MAAGLLGCWLGHYRMNRFGAKWPHFDILPHTKAFSCLFQTILRNAFAVLDENGRGCGGGRGWVAEPVGMRGKAGGANTT